MFYLNSIELNSKRNKTKQNENKKHLNTQNNQVNYFQTDSSFCLNTGLKESKAKINMDNYL